MLLLAASIWFFVTDLISGGGNWTAIVTIAVGLVFLLAGIAVDDGPSRPYGFWLHVAAGLTIGGGLVWFFHDGAVRLDPDRRLTGLLYVLLGDRLARSSWVVLGAWGILQTATYFADEVVGHHGLFFPFFFLFPFFLAFDDDVCGEHAHDWLGPLDLRADRASSSSRSRSGWPVAAARRSQAPSSCSPKLEFPA